MFSSLVLSSFSFAFVVGRLSLCFEASSVLRRFVRRDEVLQRGQLQEDQENSLRHYCEVRAPCKVPRPPHTPRRGGGEEFVFSVSFFSLSVFFPSRAALSSSDSSRDSRAPSLSSRQWWTIFLSVSLVFFFLAPPRNWSLTALFRTLLPLSDFLKSDHRRREAAPEKKMRAVGDFPGKTGGGDGPSVIDLLRYRETRGSRAGLVPFLWLGWDVGRNLQSLIEDAWRGWRKTKILHWEEHTLLDSSSVEYSSKAFRSFAFASCTLHCKNQYGKVLSESVGFFFFFFCVSSCLWLTYRTH